MARDTLFVHPKFKRLVYMLGIPAPHALGHLEYLWRVGYASGNAIIGDETDVELAAEWNGESGKLAKALLEVRFLDQREDGRLQIHDLHDHAPEYVASRAIREAERGKPKQCEYCSKAYRSSEPHSRFCTDRCRKANHRKHGTDETQEDGHPRPDGTDGTQEDGGLRPCASHETQRDEPPTPTPTPSPSPSPTPTPNTPQEGGNGSSRSKKRKAEIEVAIPSSLDTEQFRASWERWRQHHSEIRKPLTKTSIASQLAQLESWGVVRAIAAIEHSIAKGYQGIYEARAPSRGTGRNHNGRTYENHRYVERETPIEPAPAAPTIGADKDIPF